MFVSPALAPTEYPSIMEARACWAWQIRAVTNLKSLVRSSLLRNAFHMMTSTVATSLLGYLYWLVAARLYAPAQVGLASSVVSAMMLTAIIATMGFGSALVQELPQRWARRKTLINGALGVVLLISLLLAGGFLAFSWFALPSFRAVDRSPVFAGTFIVGVICWTLGLLVDQVYVSARTANLVLWRGVILGVAKLVLVVIFAFPLVRPYLIRFAPFAFGMRGLHCALGIFVAWVMGSVLALAIGLHLIARVIPHYRFRLLLRSYEAWRLIPLALGNHLITVTQLAPNYVLPVLVTELLSPRMNAYFYTTWMVAGLLFAVPGAMAVSLFAEGSNDAARLARETRHALLFTSLASIGLGLAMELLAAPVLHLFGRTYAANGLELLRILIPGVLPLVMNGLGISVLRVQRRLRLAGALSLANCACTLLCATIGARYWGLVGIGLGWLGAQFIVAPLFFWPLKTAFRTLIGQQPVDNIHLPSGAQSGEVKSST